MKTAPEFNTGEKRPVFRQREMARAASCCLAVAVVLCGWDALAVPACPQPALLRQPDGTAFLARRVGDERENYTETAEGYTIVRDADSGFWFYAVERDGRLGKSSHHVSKVSPDTLHFRKHLRPGKLSAGKKGSGAEKQLARSTVAAAKLSAGQSVSREPVPSAVSVRNLVILARFPEHIVFVSQGQFDDLFNEPGYSAEGAVGSVRDYYLDVSASQLTVDSTVADWVVLPRSESFYGGDSPGGGDSSPWQLARDAIRALDSTGFDFRPFDADRDGDVEMLTVIHSGLGQEYTANPSECVWSQVVTLVPAETVDGVRVHRVAIVAERRYDTTSITRIGVICHELGHLLGLPDLYDIDGTSSGIGIWGIMGAGSWGGDGYSPERPVHFCCWSKVTLGWIGPTVIDGASSPVSVPGIEKAGTWGVYKISCEMRDGEYFLIENRRKTGYDLDLPGEGLLIWHIDENQPWNTDESHYMVGLLQADGANDLEARRNLGDGGDPFPGSSNNRLLDDGTSPNTTSYTNGVTHIAISNISDSAVTMRFEISTLMDVYSEDFSKGLPGNWEVVDGQSDGYTWTDENPGAREHPSWSGKFMIADSDVAVWRSMDEQLISSGIDCSLYVHTRVQFRHQFLASSGQTGDVDVRVDGGKWQNVARYKYDDDSGTQSIDISSLGDGRSSVQVRWHFYNIRYGWYWGIDDVAVRGELPENAPPDVVLTSVSQRQDGSGRIEIRFVGTDPENDPARWATADCQYALSPFVEWQLLEFETTDPVHTAVEPMGFTAKGKIFAAVVDASAWDGLYRVKLRVTNGETSRPAAISDDFWVDNTSPTIAVRTSLEEEPLSGATSLTARSEWEDSNPGTTWFQLKVNDGSWTGAIEGAPRGESSQGATFVSLTLDGDDYLKVKSYHVDYFGNQSEESVGPDYYVVPLTPARPSVRNARPNSVTVVVGRNGSERGDVDYAVYCPTAGRYVDWRTGGFVDMPGWGDFANWGGGTGTTVSGLQSKTPYEFQAMASNPHDHDRRSALSLATQVTTLNSPPNRPASVVISPEHPLTADDLICSVTPASPPDDDLEDVISYRFTWSCPGASDVVHGPKSELTDVLPSDITRKNQSWTCTVQAYDLYDYGSGVQGSVVIANTAPCPVSSVRFSPAAPGTSDDIVCIVTIASEPDADPEDEVSYRYTWSCPGKGPIVHGPSAVLSDALPSTWTAKGETWTCTVEPYDGDDYGPASAGQVSVVNSAPSLEVRGQRGAYAGQSIHLEIIASDADADPTSVSCPDTPPGATFTEDGDGTAVFIWPHPQGELSQEIAFYASDGSEETLESVLLTFSQRSFEVRSVNKTGEEGDVHLVMTWYALPGVGYLVQRSADLQSWENLVPGACLPKESVVPAWLTDRVPIRASLHGYYRIRM